MVCLCVEKVSNAPSCQLLPIDVTYRLVTLDRVEPSVRKRDETAHGYQILDDLFVAIKRIAQFTGGVRANVVHGHDAPPRSCATFAPKELGSARSGRWKELWALMSADPGRL